MDNQIKHYNLMSVTSRLNLYKFNLYHFYCCNTIKHHNYSSGTVYTMHLAH